MYRRVHVVLVHFKDTVEFALCSEVVDFNVCGLLLSTISHTLYSCITI